MKGYKTAVLKMFLIILVLINVILQVILFFYTKGINSQLLISILMVGCILLYNIVTLIKLNNRIPKVPLFVIGFFVFFLYLVTLVYSPRYTYNQAKTILLENFSNETEIKFVDLDVATINSEDPINLFIRKVYILGLTISSKDTFYLVNPYDGSITETDFSTY